MAILPETSRELGSLQANRRFLTGQHYGVMPQAGVPGLDIGTVDYDPVTHTPEQVNHFLPEGLSGQPQVSMRLPHRPLHFNIISQHTATTEYPLVTKAKESLQVALAEALAEASPEMTDRPANYLVGDAEFLPRIRGWEVSAAQLGNHQHAAQEVSRLAESGLTFVIGDLEHLPLPDQRRFSELIAIKVNHPLERWLRQGLGWVSLGGSLEVDTSNTAQVEQVNNLLAGHHQQIVTDLEARGVQVVEVVVSPTHPDGFNATEVDSQIAAKISQVAHA